MAVALTTLQATDPDDSAGQEPVDTTAVLEEPAEGGLPIFFTLGIGYGQRKDGCRLCASPLDDKSFTGHVSVGRYLAHGLGVGLDASVWRRTRPGTPGPADSTGVPVGNPLANMLGNAAVTASYQVDYVYFRAGAGFAWGHQDLEQIGEDGSPIVLRASGKGIGYSLGAGLLLPVHSMVSLAFFANWNAGQYDMATVNGVVARENKHRFYEVGFGVTLR